MRPLKSISTLLFLGLLLAYGCYPGGPSGTDDFTIVRTQGTTRAYDFGSQKVPIICQILWHLLNKY
jgi:hypothetical protein